MTIVLLQPDGVQITAQAERQGSAALYGGGSGRQLGGRSGFRVGTPADTLTATSTTWTLKPCAAMIDPGAATHQGMYGWASDTNVTGSVTASDATYARKDIVFIQVNDSTAGDGSGGVSALPGYLPGTPSEIPAAPSLPPRSFLVGTIDVPKTGAGSPTATLNPATFAAAGAPLPVSSDEERDALSTYTGLQVVRRDRNGRVETFNGTTWWCVGQSWNYDRTIVSDSNPGDISGTTSLKSGTISNAPAGVYRVYGRASLYATSGIVRGYVYVKAGSVTDEARTDFNGDSNPKSWPVEFTHVHAGGDLTIEVGYRVTAGSPLVTGAASGLTRVAATLLGN